MNQHASRGKDPVPADGAAHPVPAPSARAPRRKRPRVISEPRRLEPRTELTGSYARLPRPETVEQADARSRSASPSAARQDDGPSGAQDPLADLRAKDEDPAGWGEKPEDLAERMKRDKPPHWG
ncbi:hypothetical protein OK351_01760 [Glutamicibacter sp. MNS18]|uniref:hypothetical protein n=1 Tax=Glutamicibacter sp. MNS18 TaxID=2989817 RepID=UPI00223685B2|nr:hypothetical protein [Glutamicibacter sp. MNS18]MCW4464236.1 hypothetical protein [Glutamicibacter sp. MNS18]